MNVMRVSPKCEMVGRRGSPGLERVRVEEIELDRRLGGRDGTCVHRRLRDRLAGGEAHLRAHKEGTWCGFSE